MSLTVSPACDQMHDRRCGLQVHTFKAELAAMTGHPLQPLARLNMRHFVSVKLQFGTQSIPPQLLARPNVSPCQPKVTVWLTWRFGRVGTLLRKLQHNKTQGRQIVISW